MPARLAELASESSSAKRAFTKEETMRTPNEQECLALLDKYQTPDHIILHSRKVWEVGKVLGEGLLRQNHPADLLLIRASCLLHDIGKYPCILDGTKHHDIRGEQILEAEGLPSIARIVGQHVILRSEIEAPLKENISSTTLTSELFMMRS